MKLEIYSVIMEIVSGFAPHAGCVTEERETVWGRLDDVTESILRQDRVTIGADRGDGQVWCQGNEPGRTPRG